jgi:spoIIIJ-associated protein
MSSTESIETAAPTIDQAISQALAQLGAEQDDVTIEVLSTPRSGVLGLGARQARVRVTKRVREGAHSGVMSPPPAPPLRPTPPEMRRSEARPEVRREPSREPARPDPSESISAAARSESMSAVRAESAGQTPSGDMGEARTDASREYRRETPAGRGEGREGGPRETPSRSTSGASNQGGVGQNARGQSQREDRREPQRQDRREPQREDRREPQREERLEPQGEDRRQPERQDRGQPGREDQRQPTGVAARPGPRQASENGQQRQEDPAGGGVREEASENGRSDEAPAPGGGNRQGRSRGGRGRGGRRHQQNTAPRVQQPRAENLDRREADRDEELDPFAGVDEVGNDPRQIADLRDQAREATIFLERLLELMGEKATIESAESDDPETLELNIKGDGSGILIGRHGQTLDAIEYMVNRLLARKIKDAAPISIDTESYRARRRRLLQRMALSKGEQAKREHVGVTLEPMPPRDRRVVHLALKDDPMIATRSTGDGFMRAIEIVPVDERRSPNERGGENRGRGRERDRNQEKAPPIGEQGGFKHGQKRIV